MPKQSDFTGGLVSNVACSFVGSSGEKVVDEKIMALASELVSDDRACLLAEMMTTAVRMARGNTELGDFKLANRALRELRESNEVFILIVIFRRSRSLVQPGRSPMRRSIKRRSILLTS